jgi:alkanesulfonate monooxygenase SsuD/methylene tetrahydromethanopterin reductase-like flavin-dependent oxidoreductase (luciferase family)
MKERPAGLFGGMSIELGKVGIWRHPSGLTPELVAELEALGYGAIWVGGSPPGDLGFVEHLLDTTENIAVATGIVNVWQDDAATVGASYHRITARHPGRFLWTRARTTWPCRCSAPIRGRRCALWPASCS